MAKKRRQVHMDGVIPSNGRAWGTAAVMIACPLVAGALFASAPAVIVGAVLGAVLGCRVGNAGWRMAVRVDDDALTEVYLHGRRPRYPWADLLSVAMDDDGATLQFAQGQVRLAPPLGNWAMIASRARQHLGEEVELAPDGSELVVPPQEVARWLGGDEHAKLICREPPQSNLAAIVAIWLAVAMVGFLGDIGGLVVLGLFCAAVAVQWRMGGWLARRLLAKRPESGQVCEVRATPCAIEMRTYAGWRTVPWGAIVGRRGGRLATALTTLRGDFILPFNLSQRSRLLAALDQAIAARRAGLTLPRLTGDIPEAALSPAELRVDAERGLSATGAEPL